MKSEDYSFYNRKKSSTNLVRIFTLRRRVPKELTRMKRQREIHPSHCKGSNSNFHPNHAWGVIIDEIYCKGESAKKSMFRTYLKIMWIRVLSSFYCYEHSFHKHRHIL
ncbi:hypothetical protein AAHE18_20G043400 [Arachis hypogaea]